MASKVGNSPITSHKVHSGWTSSAAAEAIKNGVNINNLHNGSYSNAHTMFHSTDYDDYDFPPDAMDNPPTIYIDAEGQDSDDSFDSDVDDDYAEPEDESSMPVKTSASFGKTALNSLKRGFVAKTKKGSSSLHAPLIDDYGRSNSLGSIQHIRHCKSDHLKIQQSDLSKDESTKTMKSKSRSNPALNETKPCTT